MFDAGHFGGATFDPEKASAERPTYVVFNGRVGSLLGKAALQARTGEKVRFYLGNGGPNLVSSFHLIGDIFDTVYPEGSTSNLETNVQTTLLPAGGSAIAEFKLDVPGDYTLVDHSIFRIEKGALGSLHVQGTEISQDIFQSIK